MTKRWTVVLMVLAGWAMGSAGAGGARAADELIPPFESNQNLNPIAAHLEALRGWLDMIERMTRVSKDPTTASVAAVIYATEMLKARSPERAIEFLQGMLVEVKNETVARVIRLQLAEIYGKAGQDERAMEHLKALITGQAPVVKENK